jgi:vitamin B12 transporter
MMREAMRFGAMGRRVLMAGAATMMFTGPAEAADAPAEAEEVVVTGKLEEAVPFQLSQYGNRLDVVGRATIEQSGLADVGMVLSKYVPGLYVAPQSGPFSYDTVSLQGSRTNEVLYLIDGVRISNRLYNTTPPLDTVPANMVDRIEVLDGGQGLFFGTQAVAGVVNIVTHPFIDDLRGRVAVGGDTNESVKVNGYASGALGGNRFVVFASYDQSKGFQPFPDSDYQPSGTDRHRGYRITSVGAKYAYDVSPDLRFSASYTHTDGYVDFALATDSARAVNRRNEDIWWAKLDWTPSDKAAVYVKAYDHWWRSHYDEVDNAPGGGLDHVDANEFWGFHDYGVNAMAKLVPMRGVEAYVGYDVQRYGGRDDVLIIAQKSEQTQAVFAQLRLTPDLIPNARLAAGVRYNAPDDGQDATVWNVSGQYDITPSLFVRGAAGTSFRLPDAESLFANDPQFNNEIGNPNLKPETAKNLTLSVGGEGVSWGWELIGFHRETRNLISLSGPTPDPDVDTFINLPGKVTANGVELAGHVQMDASWSLQGSYTHNRTRQSGVSAQLSAVPEDTAQAVLEWRPQGRGFGASLVGNYVGSVADQVSGFGLVQHGRYGVLDVNGWVAFGPGDDSRLTLSLENATDEGYFTRVGRAFRDADGAAFLLHYRGVPRTLHVTYSHQF